VIEHRDRKRPGASRAVRISLRDMTKASARDKLHFEAIASGERLSELESIERAATTPPGERMLLGAELAAQMPWTSAHLAEQDARSDGQMELARRRVALGLGASRPR
jgi:hypothetical protein